MSKLSNDSSGINYPKKQLCDIPRINPHYVKIITVGSALQDVFMAADDIEFERDLKSTAKKYRVNVMEKNSANSVKFSTGGGATNAAVTLARHGYNVDYMGKLGASLIDNKWVFDDTGKTILSALQSENIGISNVVPTSDVNTGYSTIILASNGDDHMIFTYRGASASYDLKDLNLLNDKRYDWIYISSLAGNMDVLEKLLRQAKHLGTKVFLNPGNKELDKIDELIPLLQYVDILSVNRKEAVRIVKGKTLFELIRNLLIYVPVGIITDGSNGAVASDGKVIIKTGVYNPKSSVVDTTGAGDAFSSGFLSKFASGNSIKDSVHFASANSRSVVGKIGAKDGILGADTVLHKVKSLKQYEF